MKDWKTIKWMCHQAGQPRPYADSYYDYTVDFGRMADIHEAREFARYLRGYGRFSDEGEWDSEMDKHFAPHIKLTPAGKTEESIIRPGKFDCTTWNISITECYTD